MKKAERFDPRERQEFELYTARIASSSTFLHDRRISTKHGEEDEN